MSGIKRFFSKFLILAVMLLGLPLLGVWLAGYPVSDYLEFPPATRYVRHEPFSWHLFILLGLVTCSCLAPLIITALKRPRKVEPQHRPARPFPWWGWLGLTLGIMAWIMAWTRFVSGFTTMPRSKKSRPPEDFRSVAELCFPG